jgi:SP family xylose:H+ symportor-like MFS transporter
MKQDHRDKALRILSRINGPEKAQKELMSISQTIRDTSGWRRQLLAPGTRVALAIGITLAVLQQVTGINVFLYYAPEIFKSIVGSQTDVAMLQTVLVGAVNMLFTVIAIATVDLLGRKPLMLLGYCGMAVSLTALGIAAYFDRTEGWVLGFILSYIACFALSVGPITWVILSEIYPIKIRGIAMSLATICLWAANFVISQTFPMLDGNRWLVDTFHHAFPFWLYGSLCVVAAVFMLVVPETKGRTLEEIERYWHRQGR